MLEEVHCARWWRGEDRRGEEGGREREVEAQS
jgi:hypothetical protein